MDKPYYIMETHYIFAVQKLLKIFLKEISDLLLCV